MSQQRQTKMVGANNGKHLGDTTYTKIFVGGLAWQTQRDSLQGYFEQFGEILEAVVIVDKNTGKSKGYGFVTFKDPDSAMRACQNLYPVIDGRRANCNLAAFGAQRNHSATPQRGTEKFGSSFRTMAPVSPYVHQNVPHYGFPHPSYGFPYYPQDMFTMNYYNVYGGQQSPSYYGFVAAGAPGVHNYYPFPAQPGHNDPAQGPKMMQYSSFPPQYRALGIVHVPTSVSPSTTATTKPGGEPSEQSSSGES